MSNEDTQASLLHADEGGDGASHKPSTSSARLIVLLVILVAAGAALYWDRQVARPQSKAVAETLLKASEERNATTDPPFSPEEIRDLVGRAPAVDKDDESYTLET